MPTSMNIPPPAAPDLLTSRWVRLVTALGCGLPAGVFFAFSAFVMPASAWPSGPWWRGNHVRVIAALGAAGLLAVSLLPG